MLYKYAWHSLAYDFETGFDFIIPVKICAKSKYEEKTDCLQDYGKLHIANVYSLVITKPFEPTFKDFLSSPCCNIKLCIKVFI